MTIPTTITFHGVEISDALKAHVLERVKRLERYAEDILSCRVVVSTEERRHRAGLLFSVRVHLLVRGREIDAGGAPADDTHHDPYFAVADTFDALQRQLEDYVRQRRDARTRVGPFAPI